MFVNQGSHHIHRFDGMFADSGFGRQNKTVRSQLQSADHIIDLGSIGRTGGDHGFQQVGRHMYWCPHGPGDGNNAPLQKGNALNGNTPGQVAPINENLIRLLLNTF